MSSPVVLASRVASRIPSRGAFNVSARLSRALEIRLYELVSAGNRDVARPGLRLCIISVFIDSLGSRRKLRLLFATPPRSCEALQPSLFCYLIATITTFNDG